MPDAQDDLVQIFSTNNPQLNKYGPKSKLLLTYFDFSTLGEEKVQEFFVEIQAEWKAATS
ncbi:MAG: hypothetical protein WKG06_16090 [Segetibacter sp.]